MDFNFLIEDRLRSVAPRVNCPSIGRLSAARAPIVSAHDEIVAGSDGRFKYGAPATLRTRCSHQSSVDCNSSDDQAEDDCREQQQPAPILARLAQSAYEMSAIVIGDNCDDSITSSTADSHDCQKSPEAVVRSTCRPEKHACRKWKWYRCRSGESTGSPFVKKAENGIQLPISELAVQVGRSGPSCDSEREKGSDHRPCCRDCRILVPRIAVAGSENCRQNVGAAKCWQGRAIENCEEEKPQRSQVAEHRGNAMPAIPSGILDEGVQHGRNISTLLDDFENSIFCSRSYAVPSGGEALNSDQAGIWSSIRRIISRVRNASSMRCLSPMCSGGELASSKDFRSTVVAESILSISLL